MSCKEIPLRPANTIFLFFTPLRIPIFRNVYPFFLHFTLEKEIFTKGFLLSHFQLFDKGGVKENTPLLQLRGLHEFIWEREKRYFKTHPSLPRFALTCSAGPCCITNISSIGASTEPVTCTWHWTGVQEKREEEAGLQGVGYIAPSVYRYT